MSGSPVGPAYGLEVLDVSRQFPGVKAPDRSTLRLRAGRQKSTLMKIIAGCIRPTSGSRASGTNSRGRPMR